MQPRSKQTTPTSQYLASPCRADGQLHSSGDASALVIGVIVGILWGANIALAGGVDPHPDRPTSIFVLIFAAIGGGGILAAVARVIRRDQSKDAASLQQERQHHQDVVASMAADMEAQERRHQAELKRVRLQAVAEVLAEEHGEKQRLIEHMTSDLWWRGYAACLEDTTVSGPVPVGVVVPIRRGDRSGDIERRVNGSDIP